MPTGVHHYHIHITHHICKYVRIWVTTAYHCWGKLLLLHGTGRGHSRFPTQCCGWDSLEFCGSTIVTWYGLGPEWIMVQKPCYAMDSGPIPTICVWSFHQLSMLVALVDTNPGWSLPTVNAWLVLVSPINWKADQTKMANGECWQPGSLSWTRSLDRLKT